MSDVAQPAVDPKDSIFGVAFDEAFIALCNEDNAEDLRDTLADDSVLNGRTPVEELKRCYDEGVAAGQISQATVQAAFSEACRPYTGNFALVEFLVSLEGARRVDVNANEEQAFRRACLNGQTDQLALLLSLTGDRLVDVHVKSEKGFIFACVCGKLNALKLLLDLDGERRVDVHAADEAGFRGACRNGNLEVVQLLLSLTADRIPNVHAGNDAGFKLACAKHKWAMVQYLLALGNGTEFDWVSLFVQVSDSELGTSLAPALEGVSKDSWPSGLVASQVLLAILAERSEDAASATSGADAAMSDDLMVLRVLAVCGCMPAAGCSELGAWLGSVDQDMQVSAAGSLGSLLAGWTADVSWCSVSTPSEGGDMEA